MHAALVGALTLLITSLVAIAQNTGHGVQIGNPTLGISIIIPLEGFQCQVYSLWYELTPNSAGQAAGVDYSNVQLHFTTPDNARTVWMAMTIPSQGSGWMNWILIVPQGATFFIAPYGNVMTMGEVVNVHDNGSNSTSCLSIGKVTNNFPAVSFDAQAFAALPTATFSPSTRFNNIFTDFPSGTFSTVVVPEGILIRTTSAVSTAATLSASIPRNSQATTTSSASSSSSSSSSIGPGSSTSSTSSSTSSSAAPDRARTSTPSAGSTPGGPPATQTSAPSNLPRKSNIAAIAVGVAGGALVIAALLLLLFLRRRRRTRERPAPLAKRRGASLIHPFSTLAAAAAPPPVREKDACGPAAAAQWSGSGGPTSASRTSVPADIMQALRVVTAFVHGERASELQYPAQAHSAEPFSAASTSRLLELLTPAQALRASMPPPRYEADHDHDAQDHETAPESPESGLRSRSNSQIAAASHH